MYEQIVRILYELVNKRTISDGDKKMLDQWVSQSDYNRKLYEEVLDPEAFRQEIKTSLDYDSKLLWKKINKKLFPKKNNLVSIFRNHPLRYAAAVILLMLGTGTYFLFFNKPAKEITQATSSSNHNKMDIPPGTEKAVLTLADGTKIILDNTANGTIAQQGNTVVMKEDGLLAYNTDKTKSQSEVIYNTLRTEKGGEYRSLVLSDGTKVWLNSVSSIYYPTAFIGKERVVDITGEVYFEVAKNRAMPFKVNVNGMQVEVLGTHFNINAYEDEKEIKTTLMEGAVKIGTAGKIRFLKPGQQAILRSAQDDMGKIKIVNDVDVNETVAWKNGLFIFDGSDIKTIMRQASRWYDVDVVFQDQVPGHFVVTGVSRTMPISKLLKALEMAGGVHFEIEGKKILVKR